MNILVIGSGSCEHALIEKIKQSPLCDSIYCAPGNPGIAQIAITEDIALSETDKLVEFSVKNHIGLAITCSHVPIQNDIAIKFESHGIKIFAPYAEELRYIVRSDNMKPICEKIGIEYSTAENDNTVSYTCMADGKNVVALMRCTSYNRMYDYDEGSKTSSMGCYHDGKSQDLYIHKLSREILTPLMNELNNMGIHYKGFLGVKVTIQEDKLILNGYDMHISGTSMAIIANRFKGDMLKLILNATDAKLSPNMIKWNELSFVSVVMISTSANTQMAEINMPDNISDEVKIYQSRTKIDESGKLCTNGGRVLCVCGFDKKLEKARNKTYDVILRTSFSAMYYRSDIARQVNDK